MDYQSGYRAYGPKALTNLDFFPSGYSVESEITPYTSLIVDLNMSRCQFHCGYLILQTVTNKARLRRD